MEATGGWWTLRRPSRPPAALRTHRWRFGLFPRNRVYDARLLHLLVRLDQFLIVADGVARVGNHREQEAVDDLDDEGRGNFREREIHGCE